MSTNMFFARHDWSQTLQEDREWLTSISISRDLTEQRQSLRSKPRVTLTPTFNLWGENHINMNDVLLRETGGLVNHPDWSQICTGRINDLGDLVVDYVPAAYYDGMSIVVYGGPGLTAVITIVGIMGSTLLMPSSYPAWLASTTLSVCPATTSYLHQDQEVAYTTAGKSTISPKLVGVVTADDTPAPHRVVVADMVHTRTGLEVMLQKPDWGSQVTHTFYRQGSLMDKQYGPFVFYAATGFPMVTMEMRFRAIGKPRIDWLRAFHDRVCGARVPYIQPLWTEAFKVIGAGATSATMMRIAGAVLRGAAWVTGTQVFVVVVWADWSMTAHEITGMNAVGSDTDIVCALDPFPSPTALANIRFACLGFRARQASDTMSITHHTDGLADATIASTSVRI